MVPTTPAAFSIDRKNTAQLAMLGESSENEMHLFTSDDRGDPGRIREITTTARLSVAATLPDLGGEDALDFFGPISGRNHTESASAIGQAQLALWARSSYLDQLRNSTSRHSSARSTGTSLPDLWYRAILAPWTWKLSLARSVCCWRKAREGHRLVNRVI